MGLLLDSFWRAVAYCLHPRVILLSLLPLLVMVELSFGVGYFYWDAALAAVRDWLQASALFSTLWGWLAHVGAGELSQALPPLVLVLVLTPVIVVLSLLLVALMMAPAVLRLVASRRFPDLERRGRGSLLGSAVWSLGHTLLALVALALSVPLWFVPPLILVLPPLIWGWLTYRVMSYDALDVHASAEERRDLLKRHRTPLLVMGVLCGYLGAAPGLVWASFALFAIAFAVLVPVAIWIYTLVFAFSALWFTHYCLAALQAQRQQALAATEFEVLDAVPQAPRAPIALPHEP